MVLVFRDVTREYRIREELRQSEEHFRRAFEMAGIGKALTRLDGRFYKVNEAMCRMLGYTEKELLLLSITSIIHPDDIAQSREVVKKLLQGELANDRFALEKRYV